MTHVPKPAPSLKFDLQFGKGQRKDRWPLSPQKMRRLILASLPAPCTDATITLRVVGREEGQQLNRQFRNKDAATNILTFDYAGPPSLHADLVICLPVVRDETKLQHKPLEHHLSHLLVHGVLHACGLDHQKIRDAQTMEALEIAVLRRFAIPNPYELPAPVAR